MKKKLILILLLCICIGCTGVVAYAADSPTSGNCGESSTYQYDDGTLTISGTGSINVSVSYFSQLSFADEIDTVIINQGITEIGGWGAFRFLDNLTSVILPDGLMQIGANSFQCDYKLTTVNIPSSVKTIEDLAFDGASLKSIILPEGLESIGNRVFSGCEFSNVTIPQSVSSIGYGTFQECNNLSFIKVADGNLNYSNDEDGVLYNFDKTVLLQYPAAGFTSYNIPNGVVEIADKAFAYKRDLINISFSSSVSKIGSFAFAGCGFNSLNLPDSLTFIGSMAFVDCDELISLLLPQNVSIIQDDAFENCDKLSFITVDNDNPNFCNDESGVLFNKTKTILYYYPEAISSDFYAVPNGVNSIHNDAFSNASNLKYLLLPNSLESIGESAFCSCGIKSLIIPRNSVSIGRFAFSNSSYLSNLIIPQDASLYLLSGYPNEYFSEETRVFCYENSSVYQYDHSDNIAFELYNNTISGEIKLSSTAISSDGTFEVVVNIDSNPGINDLQLDIVWNQSLFVLTDVKYNSEKFNSQYCSDNMGDYPLSVEYHSEDATNCNSNGVFAVLTFSTKNNISAGDYAIGICNYSAYDNLNNNIYFDIDNTVISIADAIEQSICFDVELLSISYEAGGTVFTVKYSAPSVADDSYHYVLYFDALLTKDINMTIGLGGGGFALDDNVKDKIIKIHNNTAMVVTTPMPGKTYAFTPHIVRSDTYQYLCQGNTIVSTVPDTTISVTGSGILSVSDNVLPYGYNHQVFIYTAEEDGYLSLSYDGNKQLLVYDVFQDFLYFGYEDSQANDPHNAGYGYYNHIEGYMKSGDSILFMGTGTGNIIYTFNDIGTTHYVDTYESVRYENVLNPMTQTEENNVVLHIELRSFASRQEDVMIVAGYNSDGKLVALDSKSVSGNVVLQEFYFSNSLNIDSFKVFIANKNLYTPVSVAPIIVNQTD